MPTHITEILFGCHDMKDDILTHYVLIKVKLSNIFDGYGG